eukprot:6180624-Pleurochrysis_carterae.AAC.2
MWCACASARPCEHEDAVSQVNGTGESRAFEVASKPERACVRASQVCTSVHVLLLCVRGGVGTKVSQGRVPSSALGS